MYVVTFYSFKGGVGRTLSLANVGLELARTGSRVLLVDFDLEAPGLDTFDLLRPKEPHPGIVEYVFDFVATQSAPDAKDYIYEVLGIGEEGGALWIMPAGRGDAEYSKKLSGTNWQKLYDEVDGFLMFEDLKEQWNASLQVDYVLIDSRTGYTDIGGICTRQLPDAVVILFFPNEQNLAGLKPMVCAIRSEDKRARDKPIRLHFVMSNVPDLDDEQEILANLRQRFQKELGYDSLSSVIYRYDSLSLLKQSLFIAERPKSRLAKEYRQLTEIIAEDNPEDRQAVVRTLTRPYRHRLREQVSKESRQNRIEEVLKYHSRDGEILYLLAMDLKRRGRLEESRMFLKRSIELGHRSPEALMAQAEVTLLEHEKDLPSVWSDVREAFQGTRLDQDELGRGIEILRQAAPDKLREITETPAFRSLRSYACLWLANELMWSREGLEGAIELISRYRAESDFRGLDTKLDRITLSLALIGLSRFHEATRLYGDVRPEPQDMDIQDAFNYGMAEWGETGTPPNDMFSRVVHLDAERSEKRGANYLQCTSIALWVVSRKDEALHRVEKAQEQIREKPTPEFSCWRYMKVTPPDFQHDCESIRRLIEGEKIYPLFFPTGT